MKFIRFSSPVIVSLSIFILLPLTAIASGPIPGQATPEDTFVQGENSSVKDSVAGDLYLSSFSSTVEASVTGDVLGASKQIILLGPVSGNVRAVGGSISLRTSVNRNVSIAARGVEFEPKSHVLGNVYLAGQTIVLAGEINGSVYVLADSLTVSGHVRGTFRVKARNIKIASTAILDGPLLYQSANQPNIEPGAKTSEVNPIEWFVIPGKPDFSKARFLLIIIRLLSILVSAYVLWRLSSETVSSNIEQSQDKMMRKIAIGIISLLVIPCALLVASLTIVGFPLAVCVLFVWLITIFVGSIAGFWYFGNYVLKQIGRGEAKDSFPLKSLLSGLVCVIVIGLIPVLGPLFQVGVFMWGYGSLVSRYYLRT